MSVWTEILAVLRRGEEPVVRVTYAMMKEPLKKRPGRKKVVSDAVPFMLHASAPLLGGITRPRCMNPKCKIRLRAFQAYICSEHCRQEAIMYFSVALHLLRKRPYTIPKSKPKEIPYDFTPAAVSFEALTGGARAAIAKGRGRKRKGSVPRAAR